jgi:hypothetical protein
MANMRYVVRGTTTGDLKVHVARADGYAACGEMCHSPQRGDLWWYDRKAGRYEQLVPIPTSQPVTCGRNGCKG